MKILFAAINAKYVHTNIAVRYLSLYLKKQGTSDITTAHTFNCVGERLAWETTQQEIKCRYIANLMNVALRILVIVKLVRLTCFRIYFA